MTKQIPLSRGLFATVDDADYDYLMQWEWVASKGTRGSFYAVRREGDATILMHRVIAKTPDGIGTDHEDGNTLRNVRSNLRPATQTDNLLNAAKRKNSKSRFKGVSAKRNRWEARFMGKRYGIFATEEDAARAYDAAAIASGSQFVLTNFDEQGKERNLKRDEVVADPVQWTSSVQGVYFKSREQKWFIKIGGKEAGRFKTEKQAIKALRSKQVAGG